MKKSCKRHRIFLTIVQDSLINGYQLLNLVVLVNSNRMSAPWFRSSLILQTIRFHWKIPWWLKLYYYYRHEETTPMTPPVVKLKFKHQGHQCSAQRCQSSCMCRPLTIIHHHKPIRWRSRRMCHCKDRSRSYLIHSTSWNGMGAGPLLSTMLLKMQGQPHATTRAHRSIGSIGKVGRWSVRSNTHQSKLSSHSLKLRTQLKSSWTPEEKTIFS